MASVESRKATHAAVEVRTTKYLRFITEQSDNCNMPFFPMQSEVPLSRRVARSKVAVRKVAASREALPLKDQENDPSQGKPTVPAGKLAHWKKPWRDWSKDSMELALKEVSEGSLTVRRAALQYDVPKSTLHDRVTGKVDPGAKVGAPRYLDDEEEDELAKFLVGAASIGYPKTVREVKAIVGAIVAKKQGVEVATVSQGWWEKFRRRHPELSLRSAEPLAYHRATTLTREVMDTYFDLLEETVLQNDLVSKPGLIFNCDESGMPLSHRPGSVIAKKGQKHVTALVSGNKTQITVLICASAAGNPIPPMVIFDRKNLNQELTIGEIPGTMYGLNPGSGWIDQELFRDWFERHFLQYAPAARPLLLLLDGHSTHYRPEVVRLAASNGVIMFALPPHTTHVAQPLDVTSFHALKTYWDRECNKYMAKNPGKVVTVYQFSQLFAAAYKLAMTRENIASGFKKSGIYPLNRHAIAIPGEEPVQKSAPSLALDLARKSGITFLPLYSPIVKSSQRMVNASQQTSDGLPEFTAEEIAKFTTRFEEGYDLDNDARYNKWLETNHPDVCKRLFDGSEDESEGASENDSEQQSELSSKSDANADPSVKVQNAPSSSAPEIPGKLSEFLKLPPPPSQVCKPKTLPRGRVLTSEENLRALEEKERKKKEEVEAKEQRRLDRERKRQEKAAQNELRQQVREEKAKQKAKEQEERAKRKAKVQDERAKRNVQEQERRASPSASSECGQGTCKHKRARNWIQCNSCEVWSHCICVEVPRQLADTDDFVFICVNCSRK